MFKGFYNLASGMLTQGRMLDVISNNMANAATPGFKADRFTASTFQEVLWQHVGNKAKNYHELGNQSWITAPSQLYTDFSQAGFEETGLPLDFAIEGGGYFAIRRADDTVAYTRNGSFSLDNEGYLTLPGQGRVLGTDREPIRLVTDKVSTDNYGGLFLESGGYLGRIGVFTFENEEEMLEKDAQSLFFTAEENEPEVGVSRMHQKMLEHSNADWAREMTQMISTQRAYQSAAEITKIYDTLMTRITTEIGRASS